MFKPWKGCSSSDSDQIYAKVISAADQLGQHSLEAHKWDWCKSCCSPLVRNRPERAHLRSIRDRELCWAWDLFTECFSVCVCGETVRSRVQDSKQHQQAGLHAPNVAQARCCHAAKGSSQIWGLGQIHQFMHHLPNITNTPVGKSCSVLMTDGRHT